jgi:hypothetical protein
MISAIYKQSHVTRNPPSSMGRLLRAVTNSLPAATVACCGGFRVKQDTALLD